MTNLLSARDVAQRLACTESLVEKWIRLGKLPIVKVGRLTRIRQEDLDVFAQELPVVRRGSNVTTGGTK
jgi:excisionase family DNA binding protein